MITPLIGQCVQTQGFRAVHMVGKNSGPKLIMNLWDIASVLGAKPMQSSADLGLEKSPLGWFCYENAISPAIDRWNLVRRQTIKRPFMSTIERFINPFQADIIMASAFHPPYGEKMTTIAERLGFKGIVIIRNGIEGSIAFPLLRPVKMLLSARQKDGLYKRHEIILEPPSGVDIEQMVQPKAEDNARLIQAYIKEGTSGDRHFDLRVQATNVGLGQALQWLKENAYGLG
jgi:anthranilate phosphoribosyltransferase